MADAKLHVVVYDVTSDKTRGRVARGLEELGVRVQRSVFEARGDTDAILRAVEKLALTLDAGDSIRVYPLPHSSIALVEVFGSAVRPENGDYYLL